MDYQGYYFSASLRTWLHSDVHTQLPEDAVKVTNERRAKLVAEHDAGKTIIGDAAGQPIAVDAMLALPLPIAKERRIMALARECRAALVAGFTANVTGKNRIYPTQLTDQANLTRLAQLAMMMAHVPDQKFEIMSCDVNGNWSRAPHTADETLSVFVAMNRFIGDTQRAYDARVAAVNAAATNQAVLDA